MGPSVFIGLSWMLVVPWILHPHNSHSTLVISRWVLEAIPDRRIMDIHGSLKGNVAQSMEI